MRNGTRKNERLRKLKLKDKILDNISYLDEFYDENKKLYNDITNIAFDKKILIKNNIFKI